MKCKICGTEIIEKELKEKIIFELDDFRYRKVSYKQEVAYCSYCKYEHIESNFFSTKKKALKDLRKTPWVERSIYE